MSNIDLIEKNSVTIVTINFNNSNGLKDTIESVIKQSYSNYEYLIIDGASTDESLKTISSFNNKSIKYISEPDEGIYHAMNKAILIAKGEWLLFMNSGDSFYNEHSLSKAMSKIQPDTDVIYSDWIYTNSEKYISASQEKMAVRHQSVVYKKYLHKIYGTYVSSPTVTISDYIFFLSIRDRKWIYNNNPLSRCDELGISSRASHFYQKICVDYIFKRRDKFTLILIIILYPVYRFFKKTFLLIYSFKRN